MQNLEFAKEEGAQRVVMDEETAANSTTTYNDHPRVQQRCCYHQIVRRNNLRFMGLVGLVIFCTVCISIIIVSTQNNKVEPSMVGSGTSSTTDSGKKDLTTNPVGKEQDLTHDGEEAGVFIPDIEEEVTNNDNNNNFDTNPNTNNAEETATGICEALECQTDRMGHFQHLTVGQTLCNAQYRFGLNHHGKFVWLDCANQIQANLYRPTDHNNTAAVSYFQMTDEGIFQLYDAKDALIWQIQSDSEIKPTGKCLGKPVLECPYIHLHKSGDIVLNYIDKGGMGWVDMNSKRHFKGLFPPED